MNTENFGEDSLLYEGSNVGLKSGHFLLFLLIRLFLARPIMMISTAAIRWRV